MKTYTIRQIEWTKIMDDHWVAIVPYGNMSLMNWKWQWRYGFTAKGSVDMSVSGESPSFEAAKADAQAAYEWMATRYLVEVKHAEALTPNPSAEPDIHTTESETTAHPGPSTTPTA